MTDEKNPAPVATSTDSTAVETTVAAATATTWVDDLVTAAKNDETLLSLIAEFKDQLVKFSKAEFAAIIDRYAAGRYADAMRAIYAKVAPDELHAEAEKIITEWQELNAAQKALRDSIAKTCDRIFGIVAKIITVSSCLTVFF